MMQRDTQRGGRAFAWLAWALMATSTACGPSRSSDGDADTATDMDAGDEADAGMDPSDDADADVVDEEDGGDGSPTHEEVLAGLGVDTSPSGPTATPRPDSLSSPPRKVPKTRAEPEGFILKTKTSMLSSIVSS